MKQFIIILFCLSVGCIATTHYLTENEDKATIRMSKEDIVIINVKTNPSTGYGWELDYDESILEIIKDEIQGNNNKQGIVGSSSTRSIQFHPKQNGKCVITMKYQRPWSQHKTPLILLSYTITVN